MGTRRWARARTSSLGPLRRALRLAAGLPRLGSRDAVLRGVQAGNAQQVQHAKQAEQSQAAAENFAVASGLAVVFGALNLNEDVRVKCLARTVQWFQELGVRRNGSRCGTARR